MSDAQSYGRPTTDAETGRLGELIAESFGFPPAYAATWFAYAGTENLRCYREGGATLGGFLLIPMGQFWGGRSVKMAGFAGVATRPEVRGKGVATRLMTAGVRELRSSGFPLAALYPATQPLYRRVGFEQAGARFEHKGAITALPSGARELRVRAFTPADLLAVKRIYSEYARTQNGWVDRGPYIWHRIQHPRGAVAHGYVVEREGGGGLDGYVFLIRAQKPTLRQDILINDMAARTPEAWARLLSFVRDHASLAEEVVFYGAPNDPRLTLLNEQHLPSKFLDAWMIRVLDVEKALTARGYPRGVAATLELEVRDDLLEENSGRFILEVQGGEARVKRGGEGGLKCDARQLAALYSGYRSASLLRAFGALSATDAATETADALFTGPGPATPDFF